MGRVLACGTRERLEPSEAEAEPEVSMGQLLAYGTGLRQCLE